ncbi:DUF4363 family protein [Desulfitobacterium hafniense]|uniref:DUF4363 family protein n=5 Tax=root TaxID=1 RepID=Q24VQ1_DESHY|nr:DUF4363 family protein [Desulfitobacterium hafniense]ACL21290.1 conserved hypothetical protein [Desulfitobacterium hafniense DCB-2]EHL06674.1 hypothetical protein HMPREF0322_02723 [Desulfitobacterium hafniense DP7]KTE92667.1 hypothetical protein AT727_18340 [Desulfitobacterium hafniense]MEA5023028.1 DUF4363 family protein [Desulfitobacterium hafniense]BAE83891.1 hypothetical protein DSY2102 [Desulfitobacterium hafniense Y51]
MLRTYLIAGIIILILVLGGYWQNSYISESTYTLTEKLVNVEEQIRAKSWSNANQEIEKFSQDWNGIKKFWSILLDHQEIDEIELSLIRLEQYIKENETVLSLGELSALRLLVDHIADKGMITLQNIF